MDPATRAAELIQQLNDPRYVSAASDISRQLLDLQLSPEGWLIADTLLRSSDSTLQFYGALSFQVKLNRTVGNQGTLSQDEADSVLDRLVMAFCACVELHGPARVLDKICSALATHFVQTPVPLNFALEKVALSLANGPVISIRNLPDEKCGELLLTHTNPHQAHALMRLCRFLAEDLGKHEGASMKHHKIEEAFKTCVPGFVTLFKRILEHMDISNLEHRPAYQEALSAYTAWSHYTIGHWSHDVDTWRTMQQTTELVMVVITIQDLEMAMVAASAVTDVLAQGPKFVTKEQLTRAWPWIEEAERTWSQASQEECLPLLKLTAAWTKSIIPEITKQPDLPTYRSALQKLTHAIFTVDWPDDGCDQLTVTTEFWMDFADYLVDYCSDTDDDFKQQFLSILEPVIEALFDALDRREDDIMNQVDDDYLESWRRCCIDFADIMTKLMETDFVSVYSICAAQLEQALGEQKWFRVEAVLQLLNEMSNDYDGMPASEQGLARIFNSDKFTLLIQPTTLDHLSTRVMRLLVKFIDNYSSYFKSQPARIPSLVTLLITTLEQNISKDSKLADLAAKCMSSICSSCRKELVPMAADLLSFCERALASSDLTAYQREKIYGSMAFVIQALPNEKDKLQPIQLLISKLHDDLEEAKRLLGQAQTELGEQKIATDFQCLAAVGKALQSTQIEVLVDSDDEIVVSNGETGSNPWDAPEGTSVPLAVVECLKFIELTPTNGDAWEGVCSVLRVGLSETEPGPFIFPSALVSGFLSSMTPDTPRLEALIGTACTFVSANSRSPNNLIPTEITPILSAVARILLSLESPQTDPALAQLCTDFLERLLPRYTSVLLNDPALENILHFQLQSVTSDAPILKRTSASFISEFLSRLPDAAPQLLAVFLPLVAQALIHQISGNAQRSELDALSRVLRTLVTTAPLPGATRLLEDAMRGPTWPVEVDERVSAEEKRGFVSRVVMLRGGRGTAEVVKGFWARCRGTVGRF